MIAPRNPGCAMALHTIFGLGSCQIHEPIYSLTRRKLAKAVFPAVRFSTTPYVHSLAEAVQFIQFCRGRIDLPQRLRRYMYYDFEFEPASGNGAGIDASTVVFLEICTPVKIFVDQYVLNRFEIGRRIVLPISAASEEAHRIAHQWADTLFRPTEDTSPICKERFLEILPCESEEDLAAREVVANATSRQLDQQQIISGIEAVRELVAKPIIVFTHTLRYMPDGRPVSWPADFRRNVIEACRRLDLPYVAPSSIIMKHGVDAALMPDLMHPRDEFKRVLGDEFLDFLDRAAVGDFALTRIDGEPRPAAVAAASPRQTNRAAKPEAVSGTPEAAAETGNVPVTDRRRPDFAHIAQLLIAAISELRGTYSDETLGLNRTRLAQIDADRTFHAYDIAVAEYLGTLRQPALRVVQPICGIGHLCLALASVGIPTIGIEPSQDMGRILDALHHKSGYGDRLEFRIGRFPHMLALSEFWDHPETVLVMTNCTSSYIQQHHARFVRLLSLFARFIVDLGHFGAPADRAGRAALLHRFETLGCRRIERLFDSSIHEVGVFAGVGAT